MNQFLPSELITYIACFDQDAWIRLAWLDAEFHNYAFSNAGRDHFIALFTVKIVEKSSTNETKQWKLLGKHFRKNDKPASISVTSTGQRTRNWYINGKIGRNTIYNGLLLPSQIISGNDLYRYSWHYKGRLQYGDVSIEHPAVIGKSGTVEDHHYIKGDQYKRSDGLPSYVSYRDGVLQTENWMGETRIDKPMLYNYHPNGRISREVWAIDSKWHRIGAPAEISYDNQGQITYYGYEIEGKFHRDDGPARFRYPDTYDFYRFGVRVEYLNAFSPIPIEVKILIASGDSDAWYLMTRHDAEFHNYAFSNAGRDHFIALFTICRNFIPNQTSTAKHV